MYALVDMRAVGGGRPRQKGLKLMIDNSHIRMLWTNTAEKRRFMHSLAMLLEIIGDNSTILKTDREREEYNFVSSTRAA
jgi:hypothetical protein